MDKTPTELKIRLLQERKEYVDKIKSLQVKHDEAHKNWKEWNRKANATSALMTPIEMELFKVFLIGTKRPSKKLDCHPYIQQIEDTILSHPTRQESHLLDKVDMWMGLFPRSVSQTIKEEDYFEELEQIGCTLLCTRNALKKVDERLKKECP